MRRPFRQIPVAHGGGGRVSGQVVDSEREHGSISAFFGGFGGGEFLTALEQFDELRRRCQF